MALKLTFEHFGVQIPDGHVKVETATVDSQSLTAMVVWRAGADKEPLKNKLFSLPYSLDGANPLQQAYTQLKLLPEFAQAQDL